MINIELQPDIEESLNKLMLSTGRTAASIAIEAISQYLSAEQRPKDTKPGSPSDDLAFELGLVDAPRDAAERAHALDDAKKGLIALGGTTPDIQPIPRRRSEPMEPDLGNPLNNDLELVTHLISTGSENEANRLLQVGWTLLMISDGQEEDRQSLTYHLGWQQEGEPPKITGI